MCSELEALEPGCCELGCTPDLLLDYAKQRGLGLVCLHNNRPSITHEGAPILAFSVVAEHAYFYKSQVVARQVMKWRGCGGEKLKRKFRHTKAWVRPEALAGGDALEPGHFFCLEEEVPQIRERLLEQGIAPRISLKDESRVRTMSHKKTEICVLPPALGEN